MLAKNLVIAGFAAVATSFTLPGGLKDGFYMAYHDAEGREVHQAIDSIPESSIPQNVAKDDESAKRDFLSMRIARNALSKRQTWCGCTFGMDHGDCDNANNALGAQFRNGAIVNSGLAYYSIAGSAVAFVCNKESRAEAIGSDVVSRGSGSVTKACGWYIAGSWSVDGYSHIDYGYMNYQNGLDFCGHAEGSGSHSC